MTKRKQSYNRFKKRHLSKMLPDIPAEHPVALPDNLPEGSPSVSVSGSSSAGSPSESVSDSSSVGPVPSASPKKSRRNIFIHPDHKEDLDETYKNLEANKVEVRDTGYHSHLRLINRPSRWNFIRRAFSVLFEHIGFPADYFGPIYRRRILLHGGFVRKKLPTRTAFIFTSRHKDDPLRKDVYLQGCPVHYMQQTSVFHICRRSFSFLRWYGYYADLDMTPEPQSILIATDRSPLMRSYTYGLTEQNGRDQHLHDVFNYRFTV